MKNKTHWALLTVTFIALVLGYALYRCTQMNTMLKKSLPYLIKGETLPNANLVRIGDENSKVTLLDSKNPIVIFIFPRPCTVCAKNIVYWNKMHTIFGHKITIYGIIADSMTHVFNFWEESGKEKIKFPIYFPDNLEKFIESYRLKLNSAQTILVDRSKLEHIIIGDLNGESAVAFIKRAREIKFK